MPAERKVLIRLKGDVSDFARAMVAAAAASDVMRKRAAANFKSVTDEINTSTDRTAWLAQGILAIAPSVVTMGAAAVPVISGIATQLTVAAGAAGVAVLAFHGIGDALKALNDYQLDPTAAHLQKLNETMAAIGPAGEKFVRFLDELGPKYADLANAARGPLFAGMEVGLTHLTDDLLPRLRTLVVEIAGAMGDLAAEGGQGLAGPKFEAFFSYLQNEARPILMDMSRTIGNFINGIANMLVAFGPLSDRFSGGLLGMSRAFAEWSAQLDSDSSFQAFLAYVEKSIPLTMDLLAALIGAITALVEAAAPVGALMLPAFTALFKVIEKVADTPLGPIFLAAAAAASIYGRALALAEVTTGGALAKITKGTRENIKVAKEARMAWRDLGNTMANMALSNKQLLQLAAVGPTGERQAVAAYKARQNMIQYGKAVGGVTGQVGLLAFAMSDLDDKAGLTNTTMLTLMGSMAGPWGAAVGFLAGLTLDLAAANDELVASTERAGAAVAADNLTTMLEARADLLQQTKDMQESMDWSFLDSPVDIVPAVGNKIFSQDEVDAAKQRLAELDEAITKARKNIAAGLVVEGKGPKGQAQMWADLTTGADAATMSVSDLIGKLQSLQGILDRSGSLIAYEQALDDLTQSIKDNGNAWNVGTDAGRKNLLARNNLVDKAIARAQTLKEAGDDLGAQKILDRAISDLQRFVGGAEGAKKQAIQPLIEALKALDTTKAEPKVEVQGTDQAVNELRVVKTAMDALHDKTIQLRVEHQEVRLGPIHSASGGPVWGAGGPTDDRIPAMLSNGEFVMRAAAVQKYGLKMMEDYNAMRLAHGGFVARGYANGGTPHAEPVPPHGSEHFYLDEFKKIMDSFKAAVDMGGDALRRELQRLTTDVKQAGGEWSRQLFNQAAELRAINRQYRRQEDVIAQSTAALDVMKSQLDLTNQYLDDQVQKQQALVDSVSGQFKSQVTGQGGLAAAIKALTGDVSGGALMDDLLEKLKRAGLDKNSGLYSELLNSNDTKLAQQLLAGGSGTIDFLEALYAQRDAQNARRGYGAGQEAFGSALRDMSLVAGTQTQAINAQTAKVAEQTAALADIKQAFNKQLQALRDELKGEVPKKIGDEVGGALSDATRRGRNRGHRRPRAGVSP